MATGNPFHYHVRQQIIHQSCSKLPFALFVLLVLFAASLSGCVTLNDPESSQTFSSDMVGTLNSQSVIGQSFISRRANLNGITIWLTISSQPSDLTPASLSQPVTVRLFHAAGESAPLYTTIINIPSSGQDIPIAINIPPQNNPAGQIFYLTLSSDSGTVLINGRNEDAYADGQAYINGSPVQADIAFMLGYDYGFSALVLDLAGFLHGAWLVFPLLILLWLPGWLLLSFSGHRRHFDFGEQTALALGISLAIIPLLVLWATVLNIRWSRDEVLFLSGFLVAVLIAWVIYNLVYSSPSSQQADPAPPGNGIAWHQKFSKSLSTSSFFLIIVFLTGLIVRLVMVRDLATPAWVDSVHHALITRLILDHGVFPSTYQPYINIPATAYHPGFHSIAAFFVWLTNLDLSRALLILGQVLNAACIFPVYLLTKTFTRSAVAGVFAALITAFFTPMPAYYTSWSRYTELTGLLILPVVLALIHLWLANPSIRRVTWVILLGAISAAGLFMVHYRVVIFMLFLVFSFVLYHSLIKARASPHLSAQIWLLSILMAIIAILLVIPWFLPTLTNTVIPQVKSSTSQAVAIFKDFPLPYLTSALGKQAMVLAGLGLVWSLFKRRSLALVIALWLVILFFLANLSSFNLPGADLITNNSVEIILFIPISILAGYFVDQLLVQWKSLLPHRLHSTFAALVILIAGFTSCLGVRQLLPILNPNTILSRQADLPAIQWLSENLPANETIVINSFAWGYGLFAGNDGGYWISPLTGRQTIPPPVLYGLAADARPISQHSQEIANLSTDPSIFHDYLHSLQYHYVFTGARGGVIPPEKLASSGLFTVVYHQAGVWILVAKP